MKNLTDTQLVFTLKYENQIKIRPSAVFLQGNIRMFTSRGQKSSLVLMLIFVLQSVIREKRG